MRHLAAWYNVAFGILHDFWRRLRHRLGGNCDGVHGVSRELSSLVHGADYARRARGCACSADCEDFTHARAAWSGQRRYFWGSPDLHCDRGTSGSPRSFPALASRRNFTHVLMFQPLGVARCRDFADSCRCLLLYQNQARVSCALVGDVVCWQNCPY